MQETSRHFSAHYLLEGSTWEALWTFQKFASSMLQVFWPLWALNKLAVEVGIGELHAFPQVCIYGTRWHWLRHEASHVANSLEVHRLLLPLCMKVVPNKALHILSAHM